MTITIDQLQVKLNQANDRLHRLEEVVLQGHDTPWQFLVRRPHAWRRQLSVKGRNLTVGQLVSTIQANRLTVEHAADELGLPKQAIEEALAYHRENQSLIELEAAEERRRLSERGYALEPDALS